MHSQIKAALHFLLHFTLAFGGLAYLFCQSLRHLQNLAYLSFKKKSECHSLTPHPNPPFLEARKGGLASASPASPASVPSLVLRATGTSSCGLAWGGSQLRAPRGRCSKLGLDGAHSSNSMRTASQQQNLLSPVRPCPCLSLSLTYLAAIFLAACPASPA